jgi:predicted dehydrogenase
MSDKKFAIIGTGFWARFQLAAWREVGGVECVALCNRTVSKAQALADEFGVPRVYSDAQVLVETEELDFLDIITDVDTHPQYVALAARHKIPVICQKPMAPSLEAAREMVQQCGAANVPLWIHENWRWQAPIQGVKRVLDSGVIGNVFRARLEMVSGFPVFENQPFFRELEQFLIADLGSHIFDVARFLLGEADSVYCRTQRVHADIKGEDVVTAVFGHTSGATSVCTMAYAENFLERERFPETFLFLEGERGSIELAPDYWVRTTTKDGTHSRRVAPPRYAWADPAYDVVHASIVPCNADILANIRGDKPAQTRAEDNLKTVEMVFAAYESARLNQAVEIKH